MYRILRKTFEGAAIFRYHCFRPVPPQQNNSCGWVVRGRDRKTSRSLTSTGAEAQSRRLADLTSMRQIQSSTDLRSHNLKQIKLLHTAIWAVMAGSIVAVPWAAWFGRFRLALGLTLLVLGECLVLALNGGRCPLTDIAARYTEDRR